MLGSNFTIPLHPQIYIKVTRSNPAKHYRSQKRQKEQSNPETMLQRGVDTCSTWSTRQQKQPPVLCGWTCDSQRDGGGGELKGGKVYFSAGDIALLELLHSSREITKRSDTSYNNEENCILWRVEDVQYD